MPTQYPIAYVIIQQISDRDRVVLVSQLEAMNAEKVNETAFMVATDLNAGEFSEHITNGLLDKPKLYVAKARFEQSPTSQF